MANIFQQSKLKTVNKVVQILIDDIIPNPNQPRKKFNEDELLSLSESIKNDGIIQPITVRRKGDRYELVSGERRLRAAKLAGLDSVPCIIVSITERSSALLSLIENIQRSDLSFFEEASAIYNLIDLYGMTQEDAAIRLGMAQSTVANKLRLLRLTNEQRKLITLGGLTERHARAFLKIPDHNQRIMAIKKVVKDGLNVEKTENFIQQLLKAEADKVNFQKRAVLLRDVRLFINTINKAVQTIKMAGVPADAKKTENDDYIEYHIRIPVKK